MERRRSSENKRNWESAGVLADASFEAWEKRLTFVVSHISRKTSEIWGTPRFVEGMEVGTPRFVEGMEVGPPRFVEGRKTEWDLLERKALL
jgi:hypothetical protein